MRQLMQLFFLIVGLPIQCFAFCGFYVAKADTKLFNKASKVVLVRDENRTVLTMANDYQGDLKEFAIVIPVPTFLEKEQIHIGEGKVIDHLDAYSAPRLVEYFDSNPCEARLFEGVARGGDMAVPQSGAESRKRAQNLGVKIEAEYTVGEYDILILSAEESNGLETWLRESGYKLPNGAASILGSYIKQKNRFFVAKVNLEEQAKTGFTYLRPLQVAFESPKFMLPIRLGTLNADGDQELFVFTLTRKGRVESTNYRTVKLPEGMDLPRYIKEDFARFYTSLFAEQVRKEEKRVVFQEYAWDMGWCDPCAADPLSNEELRSLGVFWLEGRPNESRRRMPINQGSEVFVTRLHVRYNAQTFPEDLMFHETSDRTNFQARFVMRHPWEGSDTCPAAEQYRKSLPGRFEKEATHLASLTGWDIQEIRQKMNLKPELKKDPWWKSIWGDPKEEKQ